MEREPFPPGTFELFQGLELWNKILEYLKDPLQYPSVYGTCLLFQELMEERLFIEIFKILKETRYLHLYSSRPETEHLWYFSQRPNLQKKFPKSASCCRRKNRDVWKLREVSKIFKFIIDSLFLNLHDGPDWHINFCKSITTTATSNHWFKRDKHQYNPHKLVLSTIDDEAYTTSHVKSARRALKHSSSASFYLQAVHIEIRHIFSRNDVSRRAQAQAKKEKLEQNILEFFEDYGDSISGLIFECGPIYEEHRQTQIDVHKYFTSLLGHCAANLKTLIFKSGDRRDVIRNWVLRRLLTTNPFPKLESLEFLSFKCRELNGVWVYEFLKNCPNLKYLELPNWQSQNSPGLINLLETLNLEYYMMNKAISPQLFTWPLKRLILGDWTAFRLNTNFFRTLEQRFGKTLEHLEIRVFELQDVLGSVGPALMLPKLRTLNLGEIDANSCSLNSLTSLISLEYLEIESLIGIDPSLRRNFNIGGLSEDNIWRVFPNLKKVKVGYLDEEGNKMIRITHPRWGRE